MGMVEKERILALNQAPLPQPNLHKEEDAVAVNWIPQYHNHIFTSVQSIGWVTQKKLWAPALSTGSPALHPSAGTSHPWDLPISPILERNPEVSKRLHAVIYSLT